MRLAGDVVAEGADGVPGADLLTEQAQAEEAVDQIRFRRRQRQKALDLRVSLLDSRFRK